ncbi:MAG TPA: sigma-70 family RNA polymerase sigma factor [Terriglobales bacterium]|nr:sigma-70 family RNA polymerase sigma factor [Terriglobales bacterium]
MSLSSVGPSVLGSLTSIETPIFDQTEYRLLKDARNGDPRAFEKLVMPHRHRILRLAMHTLRNHEDAEDVVQLAFLQALRNLDRFRGNARFSTWLLRIAINEALMMLRRYSRACETSLDPVDETDEIPLEQMAIDRRPSPEQTVVEQERRSVVRGAVIRLSPIFKTVMNLRYMQGLSLKETAVVLGVPVSTVKSRLHRARLRLIGNAQLELVAGVRPRIKKRSRR